MKRSRKRPSARQPAASDRPRASAGGRPPGPPIRHKSRAEETYHGLRACLAIFARRPEDIIRVYVTAERRRDAAALLRHCAEARKGFQIVPAENIARISGSTHHEGIAILARAGRRWTLAELLRAVESGASTGPLLYLDGVQNPHNLGAMLRTASHFGVAAILGPRGGVPTLSPAAVRVAEGAAEFVPVCDLEQPVADLRVLKRQGFAIVATSSHRGRSAFDASAAWGPKLVLVLGSEAEGVSPAIAAVADERVQIPGTGAVESLNVSVACGILLSECRRHGSRRPAAVNASEASRSGT
jgi:TrmH RNA methyltransferase